MEIKGFGNLGMIWRGYRLHKSDSGKWFLLQLPIILYELFPPSRIRFHVSPRRFQFLVTQLLGGLFEISVLSLHSSRAPPYRVPR